MSSPTPSALPTTTSVYKGVYTVQPYYAINAPGTGMIYLPAQVAVQFTALQPASAAASPLSVTVVASIPANLNGNSVPLTTASAVVTFYFPPTPTDYQNPSYVQNVQQVMFTLSSQQNTRLTTGAAATSTSFGEPSRSAISTSSTDTASNSTSQPGPISASGKGTRPSYSPSVIAGVAVGCAIAGIALSTLLFFFCVRKRAFRRTRSPKDLDKRLPPFQGHGEAVCSAGIAGSSWEKHLPQAESDSTIRSLASRTLDQIAMHVETFYTARENVRLSAEHLFELEKIDSSRLPKPLSTLLLESPRTEDLIKHNVSNYILSMIGFGRGGATSALLPKAYGKHWQPSSQDHSAISQAHSQWRVLTAYLQSSNADDQAYITERDAIINTASRHICKAFEPWATSNERVRVQNMVGIMKHASELGMQLFSQPAEFEWQWRSERRQWSAEAPDVGDEMVILPGLYKTTDHNAVPLTPPLRLLEPLVVATDRV